MRPRADPYTRVKIVIGELKGKADKYGDKLKKSLLEKYLPAEERERIVKKVLDQIEEKILRGEIISLQELAGMDDETIKPRIETVLFQYINDIMVSHKLVDELKEKKNFYRIILLVGAGFSSEAGLPPTGYLPPFGDEIIRSEEKQKEFIDTFINSFLKLDKIPDVYRLIARAFECGEIMEIICLNWDNLIERAYREEFRKDIRKIFREDQEPKDEDGDGFYHYLWKFHGDVENREVSWVFPRSDGKGGRVFKSFTDYLSKLLKNTAFIFLIVGYSERDQVITDEIIRPIEDSGKCLVYRIGFDLERLEQMLEGVKSKYMYVFAPAGAVLRYVFKGVCS